MKEFLSSFEIKTDSLPQVLWERAKKRLSEEKMNIFEFEKYEAFSYMTEDIKKIRDSLICEENALYCYLLSEVVSVGEENLMSLLSHPKGSSKEEKYDLLPLFALLDLVPKMLLIHKEKGIPEEISRDSVKMFENQTQDFIDLNHRYGISDYVTWMWGFLRGDIIRVGRFNFEFLNYDFPYKVFASGNRLAALADNLKFHRLGEILGSRGREDEEGSFIGEISETDEFFSGVGVMDNCTSLQRLTLNKKEWSPILSGGECVVNVHIPSGGPLTPEICDSDIQKMRLLFEKLYGKKAIFVCHSWLLAPKIKELLGKRSNLTDFADRFLRFPCESQGEEVFEYVWLTRRKAPSELSESTGLQRAIKAHLVKGEELYECYGVFI